MLLFKLSTQYADSEMRVIQVCCRIENIQIEISFIIQRSERERGRESERERERERGLIIPSQVLITLLPISTK